LKGNTIYVDQKGGSFSLSDVRKSDSDSTTFTSCGCGVDVSPWGIGGGLYLRNSGGNTILTGSKLSFSDCYATNGTWVFVDSDNLENVMNRIIFNFNYDMTDYSYFVGTSKSSSLSFTSISHYECLIENKMIERKGNICPLTCSFQCPSSTVKGMILFIYLFFYSFHLFFFLCSGWCM
jgi:hypothetical protein